MSQRSTGYVLSLIEPATETRRGLSPQSVPICRRRALFVAAAVFGVASAVAGEVIDVSSPRPMGDALVALGEQLDVPIPYEDPPFQFTEDVKVLPTGETHLGPCGGVIAFGYQRDKQDTGDVIRALAQQAIMGYSGSFRVIESKGAYSVVPDVIRTKSGQYVRHVSPLDTKVTLKLSGMDCVKALDSILEAVSVADGRFRLSLGGPLGKGLSNLVLSRDVVDEPARDVLNEVLAFINKTVSDQSTSTLKLTWELRYNPSIAGRQSSSSQPSRPDYVLSFCQLEVKPFQACKLRVISWRPMASAVRLLERRLGVTIAYEDPPYRYPRDRMAGDLPGKVSLRGGIINLGWDPSSSPESVLASLMGSRILPRRSPPVFQVSKESEGRFSVFAVKMADDKGQQVAWSPLMKRTCSFDAGTADGAAFVSALCSSVSATGGEKLTRGPIAGPLGDKLRALHVAGISTQSRSGGAMLDQLLQKVDGRMSWQVLYDVSDESFKLTFHAVDAPIDPADR